MDPRIVQDLCSPVSQGRAERLEVLSRKGDQVSRGILTFAGDTHRYDIVASIPLLAAPDRAFRWRHPTLDILIGHEADQHQDSGPAVWERTMADLVRRRSREEVVQAFRRASEESRSEVRESERPYILGLPAEHYYAGLARTRRAATERRLSMAREAACGWAEEHLGIYTDEISQADAGSIVELGTGLGLGTVAILDRVRGFDKLFSVDVDFRCGKNADGYARYLGIRDRVELLAADFTALPLRTGLADLVITHYGLDESAGVKRVLSEVGRVLRDGGRFVGVGRARPFGQHRSLLSPFGFDEGELEDLAAAAGVYPGFACLAEWASATGMRLLNRHVVTPIGSHERVVFVFEKPNQRPARGNGGK